MTQRVFVLGGGPCGLALAYDLSLQKIPVKIIEASAQLGGLAKTISWGASKMDLGPHKLFTLDDALMNKVLQLLPADHWIIHPKKSRIYMKHHFLSYPPTPVDLWKTFGTLACMGAGWDMALAKVKGVLGAKPLDASQRTFENDARSRVGDGLYQLFFKPLAKKIWGDPSILDEALSKSRIQVPSIRGTLRKLFSPKQKSTWQADTYRYPKDGLSSMWNSMEKTIRAGGGEFILNNPLSQIEADEQGRITTLKMADGQSIAVDPEKDWVVSTIPVGRLAKMFSKIVPPNIVKAVDELRLNDLWLVFMKVDGNVLQDNSWMFIPDPSVIFHRVSTQRKFDPGMVEGKVDLICCEVMNYPGKDTAAMSEQDVTQRCIQGLLDMKLIASPSAVKETRFVKLPTSYPVMTVGYQNAQKEVLSFFDQFKNLRTIGRQGAYNYIGTLDAMDTGFGTARWLIDGAKDISAWKEERERTLFYPILD